jgi:stalled ribosome alternative rescue factor ArfA
MAKVKEKNGIITMTFNQVEAMKSVRNFDPLNSAPKIHKAKKGKGSYKRIKKVGDDHYGSRSNTDSRTA